jgi:hypothetical protein
MAASAASAATAAPAVIRRNERRVKGKELTVNEAAFAPKESMRRKVRPRLEFYQSERRSFSACEPRYRAAAPRS